MPSAPSEKILHLRQLLAEHFGSSGGVVDETVCKIGFAPLDEIGIPRAGLTEIVTASTAGAGGSLLLYGLLHAVLQKGERVILLDGKNIFSPRGLPQVELDWLLWVRCREAAQAIKAADLVIRDGNVPLVLLFLTLNPEGELRRISATAWQRLQLLAEKSGVTLLAFTPQAQIGCARLRVSASGAFPLAQLQVARNELLAGLSVRVDRRRTGRRIDDELRRSARA